MMRRRWRKKRYYDSAPPPEDAAVPAVDGEVVFTLSELQRAVHSGFPRWLRSGDYSAPTTPYEVGAEAFVDYLAVSVEQHRRDES